MNLRFYPDSILREKSEIVQIFDEELSDLVSSMFETMYESRGVGLAAPQVGILKRIVVIDVSREENDPLCFINPEITGKSQETIQSEEGCLSIPDYRDTIERYTKIKVSYKDLNGNIGEIEADGLLAICLQHEIDHLNGVLFIDKLSSLKKDFFRNWFKKRSAQQG